ncbi:MAG TPA: hypothetical protein DCX53_14290 [Anaerolineae bacterium]|nr:hypothetical protein [Anaerolineae bacterium]
MFVRQIPLKNGVLTHGVNISEDDDIPTALIELGIPYPRTVIVLVGGAGGIGFLDKAPMRKAVGIVARLAEKTNSIVLDGGTQAGIMTEIGKQRKRNKFSFPLIGVVFDNLIMEEEAASILDANHTHFLLIPGDDWGAESSWIAKIATVAAGSMKSITVLINGGDISRSDVEYSLLENRPTYVMRGTGRLADDITLTGNVAPIDITNKSADILKVLEKKLL